MDVRTLTFVFAGVTFAIYAVIALWARARSTKDFYVAGGGVSPLANGMATASDWMSAASFLSMAGMLAFLGYDGSVYLMGATGGFVLLALLLAPYLRKFGRFTVPDFVGERYDSRGARVVAVLCALFISLTYVSGQMRGVGVVFSRFLEVPVETGVLVGVGIVLIYAVLGGMKGITYTQVAQYCILIFAFLVPAIFLSLMMTGTPLPQLGFGAELQGAIGERIAAGREISLLAKIDQLHAELGFAPYTSGTKSTLDVFCIAMALMIGTAGLPHVIIRFYTVPRVRDARLSAGLALVFIALLYTAAPAIGAFARLNLLDTVAGARYAPDPNDPEAKVVPDWFRGWEDMGLMAWVDKDGDGVIDYHPGRPVVGPVTFTGPAGDPEARGDHGQRLVASAPSDNANELYVDFDITVLAAPEMAELPNWVIALVAAGGLAAALSTAAGLLLVISTAISHDLLKRTFLPRITDRQELLAARLSAAVAVAVAGYLGIHPPGFVAEVVAFAFGLAASSFFPALFLGIFTRRMNWQGAVAGMLAGIGLTAGYIFWFKFLHPEMNNAAHWWFGISPEGIGVLGMLLNFAVALTVARFTPPPPVRVQEIVSAIRVPRGAGGPSAH